MFARSERLPRADFETVLKTGQRVSSPNFLIVSSRKARGYAVVIPKKVIRLSSARHRLKRQVLEALRLALSLPAVSLSNTSNAALPLPPALIVFPRFGASSVHYQDIAGELRDLLSKIKTN